METFLEDTYIAKIKWRDEEIARLTKQRDDLIKAIEDFEYSGYMPDLREALANVKGKDND